MRAIQLIQPNILQLADVPEAPLRGWDVRIAVRASALCGSDLKNIAVPVMLPQVIGHEFSGEVVEVGSRSAGHWQTGDRVTAFPMIGCMKCHACLTGRLRDCEAKRSLGFQLPGSFAESVVVDGRFLVKLHAELGYETGALVEHLACGYRIVQEILLRRHTTEANVLIIGDGPIALADLQYLRLFHFQKLTLLGKHEYRMQFAKELGARVFSAATPFEIQNEAVDVCIYAAEAPGTLTRVLGLMERGSVVYPQTRIRQESDLNTMMEKGIDLGRAFAYMLDDFDQVMKSIVEKRIQPNGLITKRIDMFDLPSLRDAVKSKESAMKTMLLGAGWS